MAGVALVLVNAFALRIQRRYTHSAVWRCTVERLHSIHPALALGWQRYDSHGRVLNLLGIALGVILLSTGAGVSGPS